ncbi:hypothetical protein NA57DRAFT_53262 [Rhizodiscina lignyota]|uniref:Uncharacterized protein n=1 Tax=Rhizodiscina lignyota TaxID=1504668 RepID=A0A9P4IKE2_9PEZI|nr:hypothetical protein NA57DRAFT_53262 [Rhizodiscina lignyota]
MFNPIYLLGPLVILIVSIPLALFAVITTSLAVTALTVRVSIVYIELGIAVAQSWLFSKSHKNSPQTKPVMLRNPASPQRHRRQRHSAASSTASSQDLTIPQKAPAKSDSWASLVGTSVENRDYEGVGGWRLTGDGEDDELWIGMNSRLELPAAVGERQFRHRRSLTGTSQRFNWSPEMRMSPVQSRARTPSVTADQGPEYFDFPPQGRKTEGSSTMKPREGPRRKSLSGSSTSSASSGRASRTTIKQTSFG